MFSTSFFKDLFGDNFIIMFVIYGILKVLFLSFIAFFACSLFKLAQTKRGFLFIGILGGALSSVILAVLLILGVAIINLFLITLLDFICVFSIVFFVRKIV